MSAIVIQFPATSPELRGRTPLTTREEEVLELAALDLQNKEIAERLGCAPATVKCHFRLLMRRLGVKDRESAVRVWQALHGRTVISMPPTREAAATEEMKVAA